MLYININLSYLVGSHDEIVLNMLHFKIIIYVILIRIQS